MEKSHTLDGAAAWHTVRRDYRYGVDRYEISEASAERDVLGWARSLLLCRRVGGEGEALITPRRN